MSNITPRAPRQRPLLWPDDVLDLQERLFTIKPEVPLYLVGGAVRNALLHRPIPDLDFVTPGNSIQLARKTADALGAEVFVMDAERGVARVLYDTPEGQKHLDFTQFRGDDLLADLHARDFTINALAVDFRGDAGELLDPLNGEDDILSKRVVLCTPSALTDDPLRVVRAIRQSVQLGFRLMPEVVTAIREASPGLRAISGERLRDEFFKLLNIDKAGVGLRVMQTLNLFETLIPELTALANREQPAPHVFDVWQHTLYVIERLCTVMVAISPRRTDNTAATFELGMLTIQFDRYRKQLNQHLSETWAGERPHQGLLVLAALLHRSGAGQDRDEITHTLLIVERVADELRLSNAEKKRLLQIVSHYRTVRDAGEYDVLVSHRFWFNLGGAGIDVLLVGMAHIMGTYGSHLPQDLWLNRVELAIRWLSDYFDAYDRVVNPLPLVDGNELMRALNLAPGPLLGQLLTALREAQVLGLVNDRTQAIEYARGALGGL